MPHYKLVYLYLGTDRGRVATPRQGEAKTLSVSFFS
nr:MAG TPA: hypothetical protein [Caudoviricetes sp.]